MQTASETLTDFIAVSSGIGSADSKKIGRHF